MQTRFFPLFNLLVNQNISNFLFSFEHGRRYQAFFLHLFNNTYSPCTFDIFYEQILFYTSLVNILSISTLNLQVILITKFQSMRITSFAILVILLEIIISQKKKSRPPPTFVKNNKKIKRAYIHNIITYY